MNQQYDGETDQTDRDPEHPTATAPDSVDESVPAAAERAGQKGPDAADPPRSGGDRELDPDEGADAFETLDEAERSTRMSDAERQDDSPVTLDTPD